jgi:hypothetical protein
MCIKKPKNIKTVQPAGRQVERYESKIHNPLRITDYGIYEKL